MLRTTIVAALALSAAPASAADGAPTRVSARVTVADLDLAGEPGRTELDRRLKKAVRTVCPKPRASDFSATYTYRRCLDEASRSADAARDLALARVATGRVEVAAATR